MTTPQDPGSPDPNESPYATPPTGGQNPAQQPPYGAPPPGQPQQPQWAAPPGGQPTYGQPVYGQPAYGQPGGYPGQPAGTNGLAIASLICAFLCSPLGLVFGLIAKSQIKARGQAGSGLATAGIVISLIWLVLVIVLSATGAITFHASGSTSP